MRRGNTSFYRAVARGWQLLTESGGCEPNYNQFPSPISARIIAECLWLKHSPPSYEASRLQQHPVNGRANRVSDWVESLDNDGIRSTLIEPRPVALREAQSNSLEED